MVDQEKIVKGDEIDLIELVKVLWSRKWFIAKATLIAIAAGLIIAFTSPKEYATSSILIPEAAGEEGQIGGSLGGLASLAGVDLGGLTGGSQTINPALYQSVSRSTPFLLELMNQEYFFADAGERVSIYDYYFYHYKLSLFGKVMSTPGVLIQWIKGSSDEDQAYPDENINLLSLTEDQQDIIDDLQRRVYVEMDWELNIVKIRVEMQDPVVAAQMAEFTKNYITRFVTEYAISKSKQQLESMEKQYRDRKSEFEQSQYRLATFRDKNQNVTTARAQSEEERLQSEYNLAFNVYNQLAQQREAIKLQIQENTPVFTVLEPIKIPVEEIKPNKILILAMFSFIGLLIGSVIIWIKNYI